LGQGIRGRPVTVVANVSNLVPKPQTPYQWNAMQRREYFRSAHEFLHRQKRLRSVQLKCHDIDTSLLEGVMCRGDRRVGAAIELAWRAGQGSTAGRGAPQLWWRLADAGLTKNAPLPCLLTALPWDHIGIRQGAVFGARRRAVWSKRWIVDGG
jgi:hypothetical protein